METQISYYVENNIDFYGELNKESDDDFYEERCLISQQPLEDDHISLVCGHKFNYDPLFNDVYFHKKRYQHLETNRLQEHQLRCPYCRNIQNSLLPLRDGKAVVVGVNLLKGEEEFEETLKRMQKMADCNNYHNHFKNFSSGYCCHCVDNPQEFFPVNGLVAINEVVVCQEKMVKYNDIDGKVYCKKHYKESIETYFKTELDKAKTVVRRNKSLITKIKKYEKAMERDKKRLAEQMDTLGHLSNELKNMKLKYKDDMNEVISQGGVEQNNVIQSVLMTPKVPIKCVVVLKSGPNKGKQCGCNAVKGGVYCCRHKNVMKAVTL